MSDDQKQIEEFKQSITNLEKALNSNVNTLNQIYKKITKILDSTNEKI